jgi:protein-S-isoprenylcysteine O-methyltransferase Ste14
MEKIKLLIKGFTSNIIFSAILFISAGRLDYIQGWIFLSVTIVATIMNYLSIHTNNSLMQERAKIGTGIKSWDKLILGLSAIVYILLLVVAGLDSGRLLWTNQFSWSISIAGVCIMVIGQLIFLKARRQNNFFSSVVRIQKERGHTVCNTGIYKAVRHPGYSGMILSMTSIPFITVSLWSCIPLLIAIMLLVIRTILEDKTLHNELTGYADYSTKTPYKLIPFIW